MTPAAALDHHQQATASPVPRSLAPGLGPVLPPYPCYALFGCLGYGSTGDPLYWKIYYYVLYSSLLRTSHVCCRIPHSHVVLYDNMIMIPFLTSFTCEANDLRDLH